MAYNTTKRPVETFLVASGDADLANNAEATNHLVDSTTGEVLLAEGQLGIVAASSLGSEALMHFTTLTPDQLEAPVIQIVQGTADSASPAQAQASATYPLWARAYEKSQMIDSRSTIVATKQNPVDALHDTWAIGQANGDPGTINVSSNTTYQLNISYRGRIANEMFSYEAAAHFSPFFVTPDYTDLGIVVEAAQRDHLVQNLVWNINRNSTAVAVNNTRFKGTDPIVALAIDSAGTAGVIVDNITAGVFLPLVSTNFGNRGIVPTQAMVDSIHDAVDAAGLTSATATVALVDLTTAGDNATNFCDVIIIMALDRKLAYKDYIPQVKIRIDVGLISGFNFSTVYNNREIMANEGQGQGRQLALLYDSTHGQRKYQLQHTLDPIVNFPNPVDTTETYITYVIEHTNNRQIDEANVAVSPMREFILVPSSDTNTEGELDTALIAWLNSFGQNLIEL